MAQTLTVRQAKYREYLRSPRWRLLRWLRKVIDLGACQDCLKEGRITRRRLQVHHLRYDNKGGAFFAELRDLTTLCAEHHAARHGKGTAND